MEDNKIDLSGFEALKRLNSDTTPEEGTPAASTQPNTALSDYQALRAENVLPEIEDANYKTDKERIAAAIELIKTRERESALSTLPPEAKIVAEALNRNIPVDTYQTYQSQIQALDKFNINDVEDKVLVRIYAYVAGEEAEVAEDVVASLLKHGKLEAKLTELVKAKRESLAAEMANIEAKYKEVETEILNKAGEKVRPYTEAVAELDSLYDIKLTEEDKTYMLQLQTPKSKRIGGKKVAITAIDELLANPATQARIAFLHKMGAFDSNSKFSLAATSSKQSDGNADTGAELNTTAQKLLKLL